MGAKEPQKCPDHRRVLFGEVGSSIRDYRSTGVATVLVDKLYDSDDPAGIRLA